MTEVEEIVVNYLKKIDKQMSAALYAERPEKEITLEESNEVWENTMWHKIIVMQIKELGGKAG